MRIPDLPFTPRQIAGAIACVIAMLFAVTHLTAHRSAAAVAPIPVATSATASTTPLGGLIVIDVVGAVHRPGLYRVPHGARVADAVDRAGGVTRRAALDLLNLAAPVADGEQVVVPRRGAGATPTSGGSTPAGPVHLNTATLEQLDALPGVGPVTAQKILDYRQQHGAFSSLEELDAVPGIGPARLDQLKGLAAP